MDNGAGSYRRFLDGDEEAFAEIMKEYREPLTYFVNGYVHDDYAAEDIVIDVFSDLIIHKGRYNFKASFKAFLYMMARSRALDHLRHEKKLVMISFDDIPEQEAVSDTENAVLDREQADEVRKVLCDLPQNMREAVYLYYFEDLSYEQIAKVMHKSKKQIDNLLYLARNKIRSMLGKDGDAQ